MGKMRWVGALAVVTALGGPSVARAADLVCLAQAKQDFMSCRTQCKDDFATTRFACRGVEPACGKACLAGREVCRDAAAQPLENCIAGCKANLQTDKGSCLPTDDACIDAAQVKAFVCRDNCREAWRADPHTADALKTCKESFRACVRACPAGQ